MMHGAGQGGPEALIERRATMIQFGRRAWRAGATLALLIGGVLATMTAPARANGNDDARLALHLLPVQPGNACGSAAAQPGCGGVLTAGQL
jgi:hypothetical protein